MWRESLATPCHTASSALTDLNTFEAQAFLTSHVTDSLVVTPSRQENYPMAVIEASLIPSLNLLCSDVGSIREILGQGCDSQLCEPYTSSLAAALESSLLAGPRPVEELHPYQWQAANHRWLELHERACDHHRHRVASMTSLDAIGQIAPYETLRRMEFGGAEIKATRRHSVESLYNGHSPRERGSSWPQRRRGRTFLRRE